MENKEEPQEVIEEELTAEEIEEYDRQLDRAEYADEVDRVNAPLPPESTGFAGFLNKILNKKDSSKIANVDEFELNAVRVLQKGSHFCDSQDLEILDKYWMEKGEIILRTSLSKNMEFLRNAVTQRKTIEAKTRKVGGYKGWNKNKE